MTWITEDGITFGYVDELPAAVIWKSATEKCWVVETIINGKRKRIATRQLLRDAREQAEAALGGNTSPGDKNVELRTVGLESDGASRPQGDDTGASGGQESGIDAPSPTADMEGSDSSGRERERECVGLFEI